MKKLVLLIMFIIPMLAFSQVRESSLVVRGGSAADAIKKDGTKIQSITVAPYAEKIGVQVKATQLVRVDSVVVTDTTATTLVLASGPNIDDFYKGYTITILEGDSVNVTMLVVGYVGATRTITVADATGIAEDSKISITTSINTKNYLEKSFDNVTWYMVDSVAINTALPTKSDKIDVKDVYAPFVRLRTLGVTNSQDVTSQVMFIIKK